MLHHLGKKGSFAVAVLATAVLSACSPQADHNSLGLPDSDSRDIMGGNEVREGDLIARSVVGIVDIERNAIICTGTLIANQVVLTAAHCTKSDPRKLAIFFGRTVPQTTEQGRGIPIRQVIAGRVPDGWAKLTRDKIKNWSDVAVLRFEGDTPAGYVPAIVIGNREALKEGDKVTLAGFGLTSGRYRTKTRALRSVDMTLFMNKFSDSELAFDQQGGRGACNGDSGGPAIVRLNGRIGVAGVTSRGILDPANTCEKYSIYTSTASHLDFIKRSVNELSRPDVTSAPIPQPDIEL